MPDASSLLLTLLEVLTAGAIVGAGALGLRGLKASGWRARVGLVLLFLVGLALRLHAPASPHDINFRAWGAYSGGQLDIERGYGLPALGRVLHPFILGWDRDDQWLFDVMAAVGALAPIALFAWLSVIGAPPTLTWLAAVLMCTATPHVRFSHTDAQQLPSLTFGLVGLAAWAAHARRPSWLAALTAGAALTAAACGRVECAALAGAVGLLALVDEVGPPWRHRATAPTILGAVGVSSWHLTKTLVGSETWDASVYTTSGWHLLTDHPIGQVGWRHLLVFDPAYTPPLLAACVVGGALVGRLPGRLRLALAIVTVGLCVIVPTWSPEGAKAYAMARYQIAALPFALTLAASTLDAVVARVPWRRAKAALLGSGMVLGAWRLPLDYVPTTQSAEYAFVRRELPKLPAGCLVIYDEWETDAGLSFPSHLIDLLRLPVDATPVSKWAPKPGQCTIYYRAATCSSVPDPSSPAPSKLPTCAGPGAGHALMPLVEAELPRRQWVYDFYATDPVKVGFYTVE